MRRPFSRHLRHLHPVLRFGAGLAGVFGLAGCQVVDIGAHNVAQVRVIQASQNSPGMDFYANGQVLAYNVGFGTGTSYIPLSPGAYTVNAEQAGTHTTLATASQSLATGQQYTAIVGGSLATLQETIVIDQSTPAPGGETAVRIIDESTHAGAVDVYLVPTTGKLSTTSLLSNFTALSFGANTGYVNVSAGSYAIVVVPTGTTPTSSTVTLLTGPQFGYASESVRTIVLLDVPQGTSAPGIAAYVAFDYDNAGS